MTRLVDVVQSHQWLALAPCVLLVWLLWLANQPAKPKGKRHVSR